VLSAGRPSFSTGASRLQRQARLKRMRVREGLRRVFGPVVPRSVPPQVSLGSLAAWRSLATVCEHGGTVGGSTGAHAWPPPTLTAAEVTDDALGSAPRGGEVDRALAAATTSGSTSSRPRPQLRHDTARAWLLGWSFGAELVLRHGLGEGERPHRPPLAKPVSSALGAPATSELSSARPSRRPDRTPPRRSARRPDTSCSRPWRRRPSATRPAGR